MERKKTIVSDGTILWKKIGGGSHRLSNGRIIKPNQTFRARPSEISAGMRDVIIAQEAIPEEFVKGKNPASDIKIEGVKPEYKLVLKGKSKILYDIVDANGKVLNEKGLPKEVADKLLNDLSR